MRYRLPIAFLIMPRLWDSDRDSNLASAHRPRPSFFFLGWEMILTWPSCGKAGLNSVKAVTRRSLERPDERLGIERLAQILVVQVAALLVGPVARHVLTGIPEGIGTLDPDLLAFQRCAGASGGRRFRNTVV